MRKKKPHLKIETKAPAIVPPIAPVIAAPVPQPAPPVALPQQPILPQDTSNIRNSTLTDRAKLLYTSVMSAIAIGDSGTDILRILHSFRETNRVINNASHLEPIIMDILKDIACEQNAVISDDDLLACLNPKLIKTEHGQEITFVSPKQISNLKRIANRFHKKAL